MSTKAAKRSNEFSGPDERGHFGLFGGRFVAETLMPLILQVEQAYETAKNDSKFWDEFDYYCTHYIGRPSPLYFAKRMIVFQAVSI